MIGGRDNLRASAVRVAPPAYGCGFFLCCCAASLALGEEEKKPAFYHDGFEGPKVSWRREDTDAQVLLKTHDRTDRARHDGQTSERFAFTAKGGSEFFYSYPLPNIPIDDRLTVRLYARANQPGVELSARVVFPSEIDPDTTRPSYVMIPGVSGDVADRWQRLELGDLRLLADRQARIARVKTKRPFKLEGAYIDRVVVNLMGGPGDSEVFLDDLTIGPVSEEVAKTKPPEPNEPNPDGPKDAPPVKTVELNGTHLKKKGNPWFFLAIDAPGAEPAVLRHARFDVWATSSKRDPEETRAAARLGMLLAPTIALDGPDGPRSTADILAEAGKFAERDSLAFWDLGDGLGSNPDPAKRESRLVSVREIAAALRGLDAGKTGLVAGGLRGEFPAYAEKDNGLDLLGFSPPTWGTTLDPMNHRAFLSQRRDLTVLSQPEALFWTYLTATPPEIFGRAVWGDSQPPTSGKPRVQPEQLRIYAFSALASGYRGLGVRSDETLTSPAGRSLLIELELLNLELKLIEPILALGRDPIRFIDCYPPEPPQKIAGMGFTNVQIGGKKKNGNNGPPGLTAIEQPPHPSIRAASIMTNDKRGQLLLVSDYAAGAQWQPPQAAIRNMQVTLQGAYMNSQAYEITLGGVRILKHERIPGGYRVTIPDFGVSTIILVTAAPVFDQLKAATASIRSRAILAAIEQARLEYDQTVRVHRRLVADGHDIADSAELLSQAAGFIRKAQEAIEQEEYLLAWTEARRAGRPLRVLKRTAWELALNDFGRSVDRLAPAQDVRNKVNVFAVNANPTPPKPEPTLDPKYRTPEKRAEPLPLVLPVSSAPLTSWETLPQQWKWNSWIRSEQFGDDLFRGVGSFESLKETADLAPAGWTLGGYQSDQVVGRAFVVKGGWAKSEKMVRLTVRPEDAAKMDTLPPFIDHPAVTLKSPAISVSARQFLKISVDVKAPRPSPAGGGGVIIRDSIGGEPLEFRVNQGIAEWRKVVIYRRVPEDCRLTITFGLAAFGDAFFDNLRVQRIESFSSPELARRRRPIPDSPSASLPSQVPR